MSKDPQKLSVIGRNAAVEFIDFATIVVAKVDTGADSSAVWASNISVDNDGKLRFTLFDKSSSHYTGKEIICSDFSVALVKSSTGHTQIRYKAKFNIRFGGKRIKTMMNLSDRSRNRYPVLIGRRTLQGKFLVDVRVAEDTFDEQSETNRLNSEFIKSPHAFHEKYFTNNHQEGQK